MQSSDKKAPYFSEYCETEDPRRHFVAFSRNMEVLSKFCQEVQDNKFVKIALNEKVFEALKKEVDEMKPSFAYLNAMDVATEAKGSIYDLSSESRGKRTCTETEVRAHIGKVQGFLKNKDSIIRAMMELFSMGGLSWTAQ
eukprot:4237279-Karenia_brevis.AAC.1